MQLIQEVGMRECSIGSKGGRSSKFGPALGWRNLLLVAGMCLAFICGQERLAHATLGFSATGGLNAERKNHAATLLADGRVLITGGIKGDGTILDAAEIYNPLTGVSTSLANHMTTPRQSHTATLLQNGMVLIAGGSSSLGNLATAEIFDPAGASGAGAFTATNGTMPTVRIVHTATLLNDGTVLITGGGSSNASTLNSAFIYDPVTKTFSSTITMAAFRRMHTATRLGDGRVLLTGGRSNTGTYLNSAEVYNPATGAFAALAATMSSPRESHAAALLNDGRVLIAGGNNSGTYLNTADIFDPAGAAGAGSFSATATPMAGGHYAHTATRLANGKVLIAGGYSSFAAGVTNAAESFNPASGGSFGSAGTMTTRRAYHTAVSLSNGSVLLAGGTDGTNTNVSAEVFNPAAISVTPSTHDFQAIYPEPSDPQSFTISNTGSSALTLSSVTITPDQTNFQISANSCGASLSAGGSCSVSVTFAPAAGGSYSASLVVNSSDPESPTLQVPLTGTSTVVLAQYTLTVTASAGGTVSGSGISCPGDCTETKLDGDAVLLIAAPSSGYQLTGWSGACSGTATTCSFTITADTSVSATFAPIPPPTLHLSTLADGASTKSDTLNIAGTVSGIGGIASLTVKGAAVTVNADGSFSYALKLTAGANSITTVATDGGGRQTTDTRAINLDSTVPVLTVSAPADNSTSGVAAISVSCTADPSSIVELAVNGGTPQALSLNGGVFTAAGVPLASGLNTLTITATLSGKTTTVKRTVVYTSLHPSLAITDPLQDFTTAQASITLHGTVADTVGTATVSISADGQIYAPLVTNGAFSQAIPFTTAKTYSVTVTATDGANNNQATVQRNVIFIAKAGDCDNGGSVGITEVQSAINMYLGLKPVAPCVDTSGDGIVGIPEVQKTINNYLGL
jgi:Divergent InlB B-repeat domain/Glucodextranase, domain B/Galactose oxidase, central domain